MISIISMLSPQNFGWPKDQDPTRHADFFSMKCGQDPSYWSYEYQVFLGLSQECLIIIHNNNDDNPA
jgi:hypothetical protein